MSGPPDQAGERRFRRLVETLDHAVVWEFDDTDQVYTFVSQHSKLVLGYECEHWLRDRKFFESRVHPDDLPRVLEMFDKLRRGELSDVRCEHRCQRADGRVIWVHSGAHREEERGHRLFRGVTIDIDHLKQAEERERAARADAERAAAARDEVLAVVAHDLRNPLNTVTLACEALTAANLEHNQRLIRRAINQMQHLIEDLVDAASIRAARLRIASGELDSARLLRDVADDFGADAAERGIELAIEGEQSVVLRGDDRRLRQALSNLVNNALKFTERGGRVTLRHRHDPLHAHFEVADTGRGIAPQDIERVFDRAWQSDETAHLGSGMGLYIAKGIVEAHGGEIRVVSVLGQGSVFSFFLPR
ncbi:MAG TPA: PAS domain-containing sensor histidine kinase [Polyangiales bacterium]|nr:PAS domain-containing sensor histidine kinase [Polyangiales bacterium]